METKSFFLGVVIVIWVSASVCCYLLKGRWYNCKRRATTIPRAFVSANERGRSGTNLCMLSANLYVSLNITVSFSTVFEPLIVDQRRFLLLQVIPGSHSNLSANLYGELSLNHRES